MSSLMGAADWPDDVLVHDKHHQYILDGSNMEKWGKTKREWNQQWSLLESILLRYNKTPLTHELAGLINHLRACGLAAVKAGSFTEHADGDEQAVLDLVVQQAALMLKTNPKQSKIPIKLDRDTNCPFS